MDTGKSTCNICRDIKTALTQPESSFNFGPIQEILQQPCAGHDDLLRHLKDGSPEDFEIVTVSNVSSGGGEIQLSRADMMQGIVMEALLLPASGDTQAPGLGRKLDTDWVDIDMLREWMCGCLEGHDSICGNPLKLPRTSPAWLVDTVDNCLVDGGNIQDFVAISYVWGKGNHRQTGLNNLDMLQQPGALETPECVEFVPPTLKHAIGITRLLGERYIWIDALCIVKDSGEETAAQLQLMSSIYATAKLTIVVLDGDVHHGLPGLQGISPSRNLSQSVFQLDGGDRVVQRNNPWLRNLSNTSHYFDRAWTFQEFHMSKRRLVIGKNQYHWNCASETYHEDMYGTSDHDKYFECHNIISGQPDFNELDSLIGEYNGRNMTFPEDALAAASGFLTVMSRSFPGGFLYGLAEICFDSALLWRFSLHPHNEGRRVQSEQNSSILFGSMLPSWSWLGWKGFATAINHENSRELYDTRPITSRITKWYSHETPDSSNKRLIQSTLLDDEDESELPQGWTKEPFDPLRHIKPEDASEGPLHVLGTHVYKHADFSERFFWRPFPVSKISTESVMEMPPQYAYLSCTTKRGWFKSRQQDDDRDHSEEDFNAGFRIAQVYLINTDGHRCGSIRLGQPGRKSEFPAEDSDETRSIELVAICLRRKPLTKDTMVENNMIKNPQFSEHYGVLWIEWIDGIAYRKGVGYVEKESWEKHDTEQVHLVLG